jgi:hypothetical protein
MVALPCFIGRSAFKPLNQSGIDCTLLPPRYDYKCDSERAGRFTRREKTRLA